MKKHFLILNLVLAGLLSFTSCDKDEEIPDPEPTPKKEQIATVVRIVFEPLTGPTIPPISYPYLEVEYDTEKGTYNTFSKNLKTSTEYKAVVTFEDRRVSPVLDITALIKSKADEYQVFIKTDSPALALEVTDKDSKNLPLGLELKATTGNEMKSANLTIIVRHAPGTKNGTIEEGKEVFNTFKSINIF